MLRIRVEELNHSVTLWLQGTLAGPYVTELENCWAIVLARLDNRGIVVNLDAVTFVDLRGKALLAEIYSVGARLKRQRRSVSASCGRNSAKMDSLESSFAPAHAVAYRSFPELDRCGLLWQKSGDPGSGWELIHALHSADPARQAVAEDWLFRTREFSCSKAEVRAPTRSHGENDWATRRLPIGSELHSLYEVEMNTPYGLEIIESCVLCNHKAERAFCSLSPAALGSLSAGSHQSTHPGGRGAVCGGAKATWRLYLVHWPGETFDHFAGRKSPDSQDC